MIGEDGGLGRDREGIGKVNRDREREGDGGKHRKDERNTDRSENGNKTGCGDEVKECETMMKRDTGIKTEVVIQTERERERHRRRQKCKQCQRKRRRSSQRWIMRRRL